MLKGASVCSSPCFVIDISDVSALSPKSILTSKEKKSDLNEYMSSQYYSNNCFGGSIIDSRFDGYNIDRSLSEI